MQGILSEFQSQGQTYNAEDRLKTELTESRIEQIDFNAFVEDDNRSSSIAGQTIKLESKKPSPKKTPATRFDDDDMDKEVLAKHSRTAS